MITTRRAIEVFVALAVLTVVEVAGSYAIAARAALLGFLVVTAFMKAGLVALFFMHLKFERELVWSMVLVPAIVVLFFVAGVAPDIGFPLR